MWGCNFAPAGWASCDGRLLPIGENTALFSLLGTFYGGDGKSSFGLPNLQASAPMFWGQAKGGSEHVIGETGGTSTVKLTSSEMTAHGHFHQASPDPGDLAAPAPDRSLARSQPFIYKTSAGDPPLQPLADDAVAPSGGDQPHNNMMPFLTVNFCIALQGVTSPRS